MSGNRIEGAAKKASGAIKEAAGKVTGNANLRAKGMAEKAAGTVQNKVGKAQDKVGNALRRWIENGPPDRAVRGLDPSGPVARSPRATRWSYRGGSTGARIDGKAVTLAGRSA
jgi:uncharacterized protein YjbJ (UPF0337 family)